MKDTADWIRSWLSRKTGISFGLSYQDDAIQLQRELEHGLRRLAWWEGIGGCSCGPGDHVVPKERERACYIGDNSFLRICPDCDSWGLFDAKALQTCHVCSRSVPATWKLPLERGDDALQTYLEESGIICVACKLDDNMRPRPVPADEEEFKEMGKVPPVRSHERHER